MTVDLSLGEFEALAAKALRGVGYAWGLAADGSRDVRHLAGLSTNPLPALLSLLAWADSRTYEPRWCPIRLAASISDGRFAAGVHDHVVEPLLLVPALQRHAALSRTSQRLTSASGSLIVGASGLAGARGLASGHITIRTSAIRPPGQRRASRFDASHEDLATLEGYAHRTYAPATDESRDAGAGAGLTDND